MKKIRRYSSFILVLGILSAWPCFASLQSDSFYPVIATDESGHYQTPIWSYRINGGQTLEINTQGITSYVTFDDIAMRIDDTTEQLQADFQGTFTGNMEGLITVNITENLQAATQPAQKINQAANISMVMDSTGTTAEIELALNTIFTPYTEYFIDRNDLDILPVGYIFEDTVNAGISGTITTSMYGWETGSESIDFNDAASDEQWEIIDKPDTLTVMGKTYDNIVVVNYTTFLPTLESGQAEEVSMTYWLAKGIGMIKGSGQFQLYGEPLTIELIDTNLASGNR